MRKLNKNNKLSPKLRKSNKENCFDYKQMLKQTPKILLSGKKDKQINRADSLKKLKPSISYKFRLNLKH